MTEKHHLTQEVAQVGTKAVSLVGNNAKGLTDFIREQNVIGIAVGLAVGGAASVLAKSFIDNIVMQPLGFLFGSADGLRGWAIELGVKNGQMMTWNLGVFLADLIDFLVIVIVFYFVIKLLGLDSKGKRVKKD